MTDLPLELEVVRQYGDAVSVPGAPSVADSDAGRLTRTRTKKESDKKHEKTKMKGLQQKLLTKTDVADSSDAGRITNNDEQHEKKIQSCNKAIDKKKYTELQ